MKYVARIVTIMILITSFTIPCLAAAGSTSPAPSTPPVVATPSGTPATTGTSEYSGDWSNCLWLGESLNGEIFQIGYFFHRDNMLVNITSTNTKNVGTSVDYSISNTIIAFGNSGFYGQIGGNSSDTVNPFFGAGFSMSSSNWLLLAGSKYYIGKNSFVSEVQVFYKPVNPLSFNCGYDTQTNSLHIGLGVVF